MTGETGVTGQTPEVRRLAELRSRLLRELEEHRWNHARMSLAHVAELAEEEGSLGLCLGAQTLSEHLKQADRVSPAEVEPRIREALEPLLHQFEHLEWCRKELEGP